MDTLMSGHGYRKGEPKLPKIPLILVVLLISASCHDLLNEPAENQMPPEDYTITENTILPLIGYYGQFQGFAWENYPLIATMGDDVNAGGEGDQGGGYTYIDIYSNFVENTYWMFNSVWCSLYRDIYLAIQPWTNCITANMPPTNKRQPIYC